MVWYWIFFFRALYSAVDRRRHQTTTWFWRWINFSKLFSFWSNTAPSSFCHTFVQSGNRACFSCNHFGISEFLIYWCDKCIILVLIRLNVFLKNLADYINPVLWLENLPYFLCKFHNIFWKIKIIRLKFKWTSVKFVHKVISIFILYLKDFSDGLTEIYYFDRFNYLSCCEYVYYNHWAFCVWFFRKWILETQTRIWTDKSIFETIRRKWIPKNISDQTLLLWNICGQNSVDKPQAVWNFAWFISKYSNNSSVLNKRQQQRMSNCAFSCVIDSK